MMEIRRNWLGFILLDGHDGHLIAKGSSLKSIAHIVCENYPSVAKDVANADEIGSTPALIDLSWLEPTQRVSFSDTITNILKLKK